MAQYIPDKVKNCYKFMQYKARQARDMKGKLIFLNPDEEKALIADMQVWNLENNTMIKIKDL